MWLNAIAAEPAKPAAGDPLREAYREDAEKCNFSTSDGHPLELVKEPVLRWSSDDDWSGNVFVWTRAERPEVIGCTQLGRRVTWRVGSTENQADH